LASEEGMGVDTLAWAVTRPPCNNCMSQPSKHANVVMVTDVRILRFCSRTQCCAELAVECRANKVAQ